MPEESYEIFRRLSRQESRVRRFTLDPHGFALTAAFYSAVASLETAARQLDELASETGLDDRRTVPIVRRLRETPFRVLVLGEFSRGKATFVNALLRDKVLPSSVRPTTAVICAIRNGTARQAVVYYRDPSMEPEVVALPEQRIAKALALLTAKNDQAPARTGRDLVEPQNAEDPGVLEGTPGSRTEWSACG